MNWQVPRVRWSFAIGLTMVIAAVMASVISFGVAKLSTRPSEKIAEKPPLPQPAAAAAEAAAREILIKRLEQHLAVLRGEPDAADRLEYGKDAPPWAKTIRAAYPLPPACAAEQRFDSAEFARKNFADRSLGIAPGDIRTNAREFEELFGYALKEAVTHLTELLANPAAGARCGLGDPIKIAERIIRILEAGETTPEDAGLKPDAIAKRVRNALKPR